MRVSVPGLARCGQAKFSEFSSISEKERHMSFEIFLICVRDGEAANFKRPLFEDIFRRDAIDRSFPSPA
jgi:hypothetical protein